MAASTICCALVLCSRSAGFFLLIGLLIVLAPQPDRTIRAGHQMSPFFHNIFNIAKRMAVMNLITVACPGNGAPFPPGPFFIPPTRSASITRMVSTRSVRSGEVEHTGNCVRSPSVPSTRSLVHRSFTPRSAEKQSGRGALSRHIDVFAQFRQVAIASQKQHCGSLLLRCASTGGSALFRKRFFSMSFVIFELSTRLPSTI